MKHSTKTRTVQVALQVLLVFIIALAGAWSWAASDFPAKPIELIVPYPAGGSTDVAARALAKAAEQVLKQPIVIINKAGGGGVVGMSGVATAKNDGYTLGTLPPAVFNAYYMQDIPFVPVEAFAPVMVFGGWSFGLFVKSDSPWKNVSDFVRYAKENPGNIKFSTPGPGTSPHLAIAELALKADIKLVHVPQKGDPPSITALLGGHIIAASGSSTFFPHVKSGDLRMLATYGDSRLAAFPSVPTLKESGYDISYPSYLGIVGPKGLPESVVQVLNNAFKKAMEDQHFKKTMETFDMPVTYLGTAEYKHYITKIDKDSATLIPALGLQKK